METEKIVWDSELDPEGDDTFLIWNLFKLSKQQYVNQSL